ncbi:MAG: hypothetical protein WDO18_12810 [Acidobacteriota bacterium]
MPQQAPLRVLLICPDAGLRAALIMGFPDLAERAELHQILDHYPTSFELARYLRTHSPQMALVSLESPDAAMEVMRYLSTEAEGLR